MLISTKTLCATLLDVVEASDLCEALNQGAPFLGLPATPHFELLFLDNFYEIHFSPSLADYVQTTYNQLNEVE